MHLHRAMNRSTNIVAPFSRIIIDVAPSRSNIVASLGLMRDHQFEGANFKNATSCAPQVVIIHNLGTKTVFVDCTGCRGCHDCSK